MKRILWVDDEPYFIKPEARRLGPNRYRITYASSVTQAMRELKESKDCDYDLIVIDIINRPAAIGETLDQDVPKSSTQDLG